MLRIFRSKKGMHIIMNPPEAVIESNSSAASGRSSSHCFTVLAKIVSEP
jgi:hypothetical protein